MKTFVPASMRLAIAFTLALSPATAQEAYTSLGSGCPGTAGVPVLSASPRRLPRIGRTFTVELSNLPSGNGSGFVTFGFSNTDWAGIPLPADLSSVGLWGCTLYASVDSAFPVPTSMGTAEFSLAIPNDPSLVSLHFFNQGLVLDPGVNTFLGGATVTNGAEGVLGPPGYPLTVEIVGGTMGTTPQPDVRILRHDVMTGALLDDVLTDSSGIADFGFISTPRATITLVDAPTSPGDDGGLVTLSDIPTGAFTVQGGPEPAPLTNFNLTMTGVAMGSNVAAASIGDLESAELRGAYMLTPPTADVGFSVTQLQPDGRFSIVTMAGVFGTGLTGCGMLLDVDPATVVPGSTLFVDTSAMPLAIPYTADVPVVPGRAGIRRKGMYVAASLPVGAAMTSGGYPYCVIPGADRYNFEFGAEETPGTPELGRFLLFDTPPSSLTVTKPDLDISGLVRNAASETLTWSLSGADLPGVDAVLVDYSWYDMATSTDLEWEFFMPGGTTSVTLPALPPDLGLFDPPATGLDFAVSMVDLDIVTGFDNLLDQVVAMNGNLNAVLYASNVGTLVSRSGSN